MQGLDVRRRKLDGLERHGVATQAATSGEAEYFFMAHSPGEDVGWTARLELELR